MAIEFLTELTKLSKERGKIGGCEAYRQKRCDRKYGDARDGTEDFIVGTKVAEPTLDPKHAWANIRTLVRAAADSHDPEAVHK
ncbi:hypothetical protein ACWX0K_25370 (plasmid) [Nitrobacteraceae bacterium UC4446_H13]